MFPGKGKDMAASPMSEVIQHVRRTVLLQGGPGLTDEQLLADYLSRCEESALAALVRRHAPMVWGVCRRVLGNHHDAEDAFQATFLVLVRKAASIASRELLGNWLYGVAHQTALKARGTIARRKDRERQVTAIPQPATAGQDRRNELQCLLDEELSRLPKHYRAVIVLCDLEGKTRKEAARQIGLPEGTVGSRLARARALLAKRLARHGLAVSSGTLAAALAESVASASVPIPVMSTTIKAASLFGAGQTLATGVISARVAALTEGVVKAMFLHKSKSVVAGLVVIAAMGLCALGLLQRTQAKAPSADPSRASTPKKDEGNLKETVLALQKRIWEANARQDVTAMKNLLADDFAGLDKNGNPFNKADELRYVSEWCEFDHSIKEARVVLLNRSSALVIYEVHYKVRPTKSKEVRSMESRQGTGAWARRNGQWWYLYKESHNVSPAKQDGWPTEMLWQKAIELKGALEKRERK
jgi:RNA polymerase sigma factor (sigma-70 family)